MSTVRHTPGPWVLCDNGDYSDYDGDCRVILDSDQAQRLAIVLATKDQADRQANAALIAAAPEMLNALKELSTLMTVSTGVTGFHLNGSVMEWDEGEFLSRDTLNSLIARAEGRRA
jgi:hypothetical protein